VRQIAEFFYRQSRRWRSGGEEDLKKHKGIQKQPDEMGQKTDAER
jgi:hypothetical protein